MTKHINLFGSQMISMLLLLTIVQAGEFRRFGIESGFLIGNTTIDVPGLYKDIGVSASGGQSIDIGIGGYIYATQMFRVNLEGHYWTVPFNPSFSGEFTIDNSQIQGRLEEEGALDYIGMSIDGDFEAKYAFIGIGLDFSFANWYKSDINAFNNSGILIATAKNSKQSFLTDKFNNRADIVLKAGLKIPIFYFTIRPTISFALPTSPFFDTHVTVYDPVMNTSGTVNFTAFTLKYGIWLSYSL